MLRLCACYRNRTPDLQMFSLMVVGLDENKDLLWACNVEGSAQPSSVGLLRDTECRVPPGTLKRTASLSLRLYSATVPQVAYPSGGTGN